MATITTTDKLQIRANLFSPPEVECMPGKPYSDYEVRISLEAEIHEKTVVIEYRLKD
jgi:hypothetical protein